MTLINNKYILARLEDYYRQVLEDDPEIVEDAIDIASDLIYGTHEIPGICSDRTYDEISEQDYYSYLESTYDASTLARTFGSDEYKAALFFDVRDRLDAILQSELVDSHQNRVSLWGECPKSLSTSYSIRDGDGEVTEIHEPRELGSRAKSGNKH